MYYMQAAKRITLYLSLLSVWCAAAHAADSALELTKEDKEAVRDYLDRNSSGYMPTKREPVYRLLTDGGPDVVKCLDSFCGGSSTRTTAAYYTMCKVASSSTVSETRQEAVLTIARRVLDATGRTLPTFRLAWLYGQIVSADFSVEAQALVKRALTKIVNNEVPASAEVFALCGASGDTSLIPLLAECDKRVSHECSKDYPLSMRPALLASARLGQKEAIRECIGLVDALPELLRVRNLDKLSYVRQSEVAEYIRQFLFSDAKEPDLGIDALGGPYAASASGAFHEMLIGFPWQEDLQTRRKWVTDLKEWPLKR